MSRKPKAVRDAEKAAVEAEEALGLTETGEPEEEPQTDEAENEEAVETQPQESEEFADETYEELETEEPEDDLDISDFLTEEPDVWEQRYHTLQGKYNSEIPRMSQQIEYLRGQLDAMQNAKQDTGNPDKGPVSMSAGVGYKAYLKPEELEEYDDKVLEMQARLAKGVAEEIVQTVLADKLTTIERELSQVSQTAVSAKTETFWDKVERAFPGASAINDTPEWAEFLNRVDTLTGVPYRDIGQQSIVSGNVSGVVELFKLFAADVGLDLPELETPVEEAETEEPWIEEAEEPVAPPVKPSRSKSGVVPTQEAEPEKISLKDIEKFKNDVVRGHYRGREAERKAIEDKIDEAMSSGLIAA